MTSVPQPRAGQIWWVDSDPIRGHEHAGARPALVISNEEFNTTPHSFCIVVPLTRTFHPVPSHLPVDPPLGSLAARSYLLCEQAKSISITRLRRLLGTVDAETVQRTQEMVGRFIDR